MTRIRTATAALLLTTALPLSAWADVTAEQVWEQMRDILEASSAGNLSIGSESKSNGTLTVTGIEVTTDITTEDEMFGMAYTSAAKTIVTYDTMTFAENSDGSVTITMADLIPVVFSSTETFDDETTTTTGRAEIRSDNMATRVSDQGETLIYDFTADAMTLALTEISGDDINLSGPAVAKITDLAGQYSVTPGDLWEMAHTMTTGPITFAANMTVDQEGGFDVTGRYDSLSLSGTMKLPQDVDYDDPAAVYEAGLAVDVTYALGAAEAAFNATGPEGGMEANITSSGTTAALMLDKTMMKMDSTTKDMALTASGDEIPFPINAKIAEQGFGLTMPLSPTDEPADAGVKITLAGLELNDEIWGLFDPNAILPRDPATLRLDIAAKVKMLMSLLDPEQMEAVAMTDGVPGELQSATLNALELDVAGARLTGGGAVTFDNTDTTSFDGMPAPIGLLTFDATGINGLIDNLVKMGMIPADQAMMPQMMLGMFAKPVGDDALTSEIEFKKGGEIYANGQRVR